MATAKSEVKTNVMHVAEGYEIPGVEGFVLGENYILRCVTMIYTGKLIGFNDQDVFLINVAWVAETARYKDFVEKGEVNECEPYPENEIVAVNRGALSDRVILRAPLLRTQK